MSNILKPRIMIFCGDDSHHKYLISKFSSSQNVVLAIVEQSMGSFKRLAKARNYKSFFNLLYHRVRRIISGTSRYRRRYFSLDRVNKNTVPILKVDNINNDIVPLSIQKYNPDIIVVMGTSIIKNNVLKAADNTLMINIHGGYLPDYKGNHCFFFALLNEDFSKIASTIHLIDSGIDSGAVICRIHPVIYMRDNAEKLYCRAEKSAIHELDKLITKQGVNIARLAVPQPKCGNIYYTKDRTFQCEVKMCKIRYRMKKICKEIVCKQHIDYLCKFPNCRKS